MKISKKYLLRENHYEHTTNVNDYEVEVSNPKNGLKTKVKVDLEILYDEDRSFGYDGPSGHEMHYADYSDQYSSVANIELCDPKVWDELVANGVWKADEFEDFMMTLYDTVDELIDKKELVPDDDDIDIPDDDYDYGDYDYDYKYRR